MLLSAVVLENDAVKVQFEVSPENRVLLASCRFSSLHKAKNVFDSRARLIHERLISLRHSLGYQDAVVMVTSIACMFLTILQRTRYLLTRCHRVRSSPASQRTSASSDHSCDQGQSPASTFSLLEAVQRPLANKKHSLQRKSRKRLSCERKLCQRSAALSLHSAVREQA